MLFAKYNRRSSHTDCSTSSLCRGYTTLQLIIPYALGSLVALSLVLMGHILSEHIQKLCSPTCTCLFGVLHVLCFFILLFVFVILCVLHVCEKSVFAFVIILRHLHGCFPTHFGGHKVLYKYLTVILMWLVAGFSKLSQNLLIWKSLRVN